MEVKKLPARPSLEQYKKQAKDLIKTFKTRNADALERIRAVHPRLRKMTQGEIAEGKFALADAQLVIAREHGFESWPKFADCVEGLQRRNSPVAQFEAAADAIISGDLATLRELLERDPGLIRARSTRTHRATLLHYVAANGVENYRQKTPQNVVPIAELLLRAGAEVDAMADMYGGGSTTLGLVATSIHPEQAGVQNALMETLLKHGADIDHPQGAGNRQCLVNGCHANGRRAAVEFLASRGARLDLEAAAGLGRLDVVRSFFDAKRELKASATEAQMKSGFNWACEYGRTAVVEFLLQTKLDVNAIHRGETGLHWAAFGGHADIVRLLLQHRARADVKDQAFDGTPLGWALYAWGGTPPGPKRDRYYEVVELLVGAGATIDPAWLNEEDRGLPLERKLREDARMAMALGGRPKSRHAS